MNIGDVAPVPPEHLRSEEEIVASWKGDIGQPLVSINCPAFNHVDYIRDAIHGFLMQETEFPFNVVIHDDASSDGTADVVRDYEQRYPRIIKGIYQDRNLYSQGIKRDRYTGPFLKGKYVAHCDGDDYWMDPRKLQIQVGFLEANPDYVISCHDAFILDDERRVVSLSKLHDKNKRDLASKELIEIRGWILTLSRVYRNVGIRQEPESRYILNGDNFFLTRIGWYGNAKYHAEIRPAGYRQHEGGIWSKSSKDDQRAASISSYLWMARYYRRVGKLEQASLFEEKARRILMKSSHTGLLATEIWSRFSPRRLLKAVNRRL